MNNATWAKLIIDTLQASGVRYFCLAPGSRSSPLAIAAAESSMELLVHFDERGLGFLALGLSKPRKEPVAILTTSGTATGNLVPAVMEASYDELPLIILSADRPPELRDVGANQVADQVRMFANYTRWQVDLPCGESFLARFLVSTIQHGVAISKRRKGPIQINCMLREPLINGPVEKPVLPSYYHEDGIMHLSQSHIEALASELDPIEEGIIVCGQASPMEADLLAKRLQWPLFADIASSLRGKSGQEICYYEPIIRNSSTDHPRVIIQFGKRLTSKFLLEFCKKSGLSHYIQFDDSFSRYDPHHFVTHRFQVDPKQAAIALCNSLEQKEKTSWFTKWEEASDQVAQKINEALENSYSEPGFAYGLTKTNISNFFFANSMPIRDAEAFFFPYEKSSRIFVNRGLSGIDGNLATCAGIAYSCESPLIAVIGDLAFLHDLNSLAILQEIVLPILFLIINNQGGGIFSFLPHLENATHYEKIIACSHDYRFKSSAEQFNVPYFAANDHEELSTLLHQFEENPTTCIVEVFTNRDENLKWHREIENLIKSSEIIL